MLQVYQLLFSSLAIFSNLMFKYVERWGHTAKLATPAQRVSAALHSSAAGRPWTVLTRFHQKLSDPMNFFQIFFSQPAGRMFLRPTGCEKNIRYIFTTKNAGLFFSQPAGREKCGPQAVRKDLQEMQQI